MAKNETARVRTTDLASDTSSYATLQTIGNYQPVNNTYSKENGAALYQQLQAAQTQEAQAEAAFKTARDIATTAEWAFRNYMLGVKDQVRAQYGADSNELQSLGLKKKTEYKRPTSKATKG